MTLEQKFVLVAPRLVGIWRYNIDPKRPPKWCATWVWKGNYVDTTPSSTVEGAVDKVWTAWWHARNSRRRPRRRPGYSEG